MHITTLAACVYLDLDDLQKAIEFFQLSLSIAEKTGKKNF